VSVVVGTLIRVDFDDLLDPLDPLNPLHSYYWAAWVCPNCAEDGDAEELVDGNRCPNCRAVVERLP
jgi:hypothetical protein